VGFCFLSLLMLHHFCFIHPILSTFGILVTLVAYFLFGFCPSCPSCLANCKQRLHNIPYARHYKPRLVFFFTQFSLWLRLILQTIYVLKVEILHFLSSKSAAYKRERLQIESGLWWRAYGIRIFVTLSPSDKKPKTKNGMNKTHFNEF